MTATPLSKSIVLKIVRVAIALIYVIAFASPAVAAPTAAEKAAAHYKQGKAYLDAKQYDQAIVEFQAAYAIDKKASHLFNIASSYEAKGDYDHALEYYQKYLDAEPGSARATEVRGRIAATTQARADAEAKRKADEQAAALEAKRVAALVHVKQAAAFEQAGAWDKAGDEHRQAFTVDPNPDHLLAAAEAYRKHGDLAKARDAYTDYLAKVPLGDKSDATRLKLADVVREISKAEELKTTKPVEPPPKEPPKPKDQRIAVWAGYAATSASKGKCDHARELARDIRKQDPEYYTAVVLPSLGACAESMTTNTPRRVGGVFELRLGLMKSSDFVEGTVAARSKLGSPPQLLGIGAFVDIAASPKLRLRAGLRATAGSLSFDSCSTGASFCPRTLHVQFGGPAFSVQPVVYLDNGIAVHLLFGAALGLPIGKGGFDLDNGMGGSLAASMDVALKPQLDIEAGIGFRRGKLFANLVVSQSATGLTDEVDVGSAKSAAISVGLTSLR